jgi:hypothetical protein
MAKYLPTRTMADAKEPLVLFLIGTILDTGGDQNAGAVALGYAGWTDLLDELDEAMLLYYSAAGVPVPAK